MREPPAARGVSWSTAVPRTVARRCSRSAPTSSAWPPRHARCSPGSAARNRQARSPPGRTAAAAGPSRHTIAACALAPGDAVRRASPTRERHRARPWGLASEHQRRRLARALPPGGRTRPAQRRKRTPTPHAARRPSAREHPRAPRRNRGHRPSRDRRAAGAGRRERRPVRQLGGGTRPELAKPGELCPAVRVRGQASGAPALVDDTTDGRPRRATGKRPPVDPRSRRLTNSLPVVRWRRVVPLGDPWSRRDDRDPRLAVGATRSRQPGRFGSEHNVCGRQGER